MRRAIALWGAFLVAACVLVGCSSSHHAWNRNLPIQPAMDVPTHFLVGEHGGKTEEPAPGPCRNPMIDPRDGTRIVLVRSSEGRGYYRVPMALFPPWERVTTMAPGITVTRPAGYHPIFAPPAPEPAALEPAQPSGIRWFDYQSSRDEGHSDDEIAQFLGEAQQKHEPILIRAEDYATYTGKANAPGSNPAAIAPYVKPRPLEESIAASSVHRNSEPSGAKGVRLDVVRLMVQLLAAAGVVMVGFALPAGRRADLEGKS